jgi:hypothetical protein
MVILVRQGGSDTTTSNYKVIKLNRIDWFNKLYYAGTITSME